MGTQPPHYSSQLLKGMPLGMPGAGDLSDDGYWATERPLVCDVLDASLAESDYRGQLLGLLDRWLGASPSDETIDFLPAMVCQAHGSQASSAVPVCVAWQMIRLAAKLLDDVEDGDLSDRQAETVNLAVGLVFAGQLAILKLVERGMASEQVQDISREWARACLMACDGQHADLSATARVADLDPNGWLEIAASKSGALLGWAAWVGGMVAGADDHALSCYREYGTSLGVLLQVADDYNGVWHPDAGSDLAMGRPTLSGIYALSVADVVERQRLLDLLARARGGDAEAESRARKLLTDLGAQAFLLVAARTQQRRAQRALQDALQGAQRDGPHAQPLFDVLDSVFPPIRGLGGLAAC